jgi:hypothetical protein
MPETKDNWLVRQVENAKKDIENWPDWMKKTSGTNAAVYSPYRNKVRDCQEDAMPPYMSDATTEGKKT